IAPERTETTYALDNAPCQAEVIDETTVRVTAPSQPAAGIQKQVDVTLKTGEPCLHVTSRIKNVSTHPLTYPPCHFPLLNLRAPAFAPSCRWMSARSPHSMRRGA